MTNHLAPLNQHSTQPLCLVSHNEPRYIDIPLPVKPHVLPLNYKPSGGVNLDFDTDFLGFWHDWIFIMSGNAQKNKDNGHIDLHVNQTADCSEIYSLLGEGKRSRATPGGLTGD